MKDKENSSRPHFLWLAALTAVGGFVCLFYLVVASGLLVAVVESLT